MDFDVPLPELGPTDSERDGPHPVHYHLFMSRTSAVVYRFRKSIRSGPNDVDQLTRIVRAADAELAEIIDTLPAHLQPENGDSDEIRRLEVDHPWVKWQRFDLTVVLLHIRLRINRTLQTQWLESPGKYEWARSVSMSSASSVIWINYNWDQPATMRKQWCASLPPLPPHQAWRIGRSPSAYTGPSHTTYLTRPSFYWKNSGARRDQKLRSTARSSEWLSSCSAAWVRGMPWRIRPLLFYRRQWMRGARGGGYDNGNGNTHTHTS